jgi:CO dehydrogenase nickel-insertion accessory protein CooC1
VEGELPEPIKQKISTFEIPLIGTVPASNELRELDIQGRAIAELDVNSAPYKAVAQILGSLGL